MFASLNTLLLNRRSGRGKPAARPRSRRPDFERLEDRATPTVTPSGTAADFHVDITAGETVSVGRTDNFKLRVTADGVDQDVQQAASSIEKLTIDATNNFWGSAAGPFNATNNPTGNSAVQVSDAVTPLTPFAASAFALTFTPPAIAKLVLPSRKSWHARWIAVSDDEHIVSRVRLGPCRFRKYDTLLAMLASVPERLYSPYITPA